jgi:tetratricopeptide (TPR) repeat protein
MSNSSLERWQRAESFWAARQADAARREYDILLSDPDWMLPANLRLGAIALETGQLRAAVSHALAAFYAREPDPVLLEALCRLLLNVGELRAALHCVDDPSVAACSEPEVLAGMGKMMSEQGQPERAATLLRRARALGLDTPDLRFHLGNSESYAGNVDAAETELEACLAHAPNFAPAHRALAKLRRATPERNHVPRLREVLARYPATHKDTPLLHYALFKELDDLGDAAAAWPALEEGMRLRRRQVRFDGAAEKELFDELMKVRAKAPPPADPGPVPIFIVGMPRSGTTLLERMLGAHPQVTDAGELRDFTVQLRWCCQRLGGPHLDAELVRAAHTADLSELGRRYLGHTQWQAKGRAFFTDKLPANFLNVGFIANAMPQARILHMVREPMDVCFSNLKELFGDAYPHSYDQGEMATHFQRYRALMAHWRRQFPGQVLDVHYDQLVTDPEAAARAVLGHCGLDWEPAVLAIEARTDAVATASAAQVREPIHRRFLGQWRKYEGPLQPLRQALGPLADEG